MPKIKLNDTTMERQSGSPEENFHLDAKTKSTSVNKIFPID